MTDPAIEGSNPLADLAACIKAEHNARPEEEMNSVAGAEPHFDADGNFIHRCRACGKEASFGYGVSLRNNKLGTWFCAEHRPVTQRKEEQSPGGSS